MCLSNTPPPLVVSLFRKFLRPALLIGGIPLFPNNGHVIGLRQPQRLHHQIEEVADPIGEFGSKTYYADTLLVLT